WLDKGIDPNRVDRTGTAALHYAAFNNQSEIVEILLQRGADPNVCDNEGQTPLLMALLCNHGAEGLKTTRILLKNGANVDVPLISVADKHVAKTEGRNFGVGNVLHHLHGLSSSHATDVLDTLVQSSSFHAALNAKNIQGRTPLLEACYRKDITLATRLIQEGASVDIPDEKGYNPLHASISWDMSLVLVPLLIEAGAPLDREDAGEGITPLHIACRVGNLNAVCVLLEAGADATRRMKSGYTPLHLAVAHGKASVVSTLLDWGVLLPVVEGRGSEDRDEREEQEGRKEFKPTPVAKRNMLPLLAMASVRGFLDVVLTLVAAGCGVNVCDVEGYTALHYAVAHGKCQVVRVLLEAGAMPGHSLNVEGISPLHSAAGSNKASEAQLAAVTQVLLPRLELAQVNAQNHQGDTPLLVAVREIRPSVLKLILEAGGQVEMRSVLGHLPLTVAVNLPPSERLAKIVKYLLNYGANPEGLDKQGNSPLAMATQEESKYYAMVVEELVEAKADVNALSPGESFLAPIHFAAKFGSGDAIRLLCSSGECDVEAVTLPPGRTTALVLAVQEGHVDTVRALLECGADPETPLCLEDGTAERRCLIQHAVALGRGDIAKLLMEGLVFKQQAE
ncbi:unnamed protein product, partial [Choristocarpus tenellus]